MQAAVGVAQLEKLDAFIAARRRNAERLTEQLSDVEWLALPREIGEGVSSWFGYAVRVLPGAPLDRNALVRELNDRKIGTRLVFAGNLTRQPAYADVAYRVAGELGNADTIMNDVFWIGTYPGLGDAEIDYICESIKTAGRTVAPLS
jgi:CDP-6-deoxy-D-xylo-4-hexulose-3-dehydrase